jgi:hydrogenase maturation protease
MRGDDAAGLVVARQLKEQGLDAREHESDTLDLLECWRAEDAVVLIDATCSGAAAGTVVTLDGWRPGMAAVWRCSTHTVGVAEALELARVLGRLPARLVIYGIEGRRFEAGGPMSAEVERACEEVAGLIAKLCRGRFHTCFLRPAGDR